MTVFRQIRIAGYFAAFFLVMTEATAAQANSAEEAVVVLLANFGSGHASNGGGVDYVFGARRAVQDINANGGLLGRGPWARRVGRGRGLRLDHRSTQR